MHDKGFHFKRYKFSMCFLWFLHKDCDKEMEEEIVSNRERDLADAARILESAIKLLFCTCQR
jgi:hypothetical protein